MMNVASTRKTRLTFSTLFLQRLTGLVQTILDNGGDGCVVVEVRGGRVRRLQLRLDRDVPPAADVFQMASSTTE